MQIKQFEGTSLEVVESKTNLWLDLEENHSLKNIMVSTKKFLLTDYLPNGSICNQWFEYITTIQYNY